MALRRGRLYARSQNLFPSSFEPEELLFGVERVPASIDIDEPITMRAGETKTVEFRYRSGVPDADAFGLTWYATEADAELRRNRLQDEPLPDFTIRPHEPRADTGALQQGTVDLVAPANMRPGIIWGRLTIYQED